MPGVAQVLVTLDHLERVSTFQEFVQIFSQFGNEMVEFAHLTGDRQNVSGIAPASFSTPPLLLRNGSPMGKQCQNITAWTSRTVQNPGKDHHWLLAFRTGRTDLCLEMSTQ